jgi:hypothetical protein
VRCSLRKIPFGPVSLIKYASGMSASFVNYQIKSDDQAAVAAASSELVMGRAFVSPPKGGWVTLYDENSEIQDAYEIGRLGSEMSTRLGTVVIAFLVHESSLFVYYLFDNGDLLDEYNSVPPPTSADAEEDQKVRFAGRPEILLQYCPPGTHRGDLEVALLRGDTLIEGGFASSVNAEERLHPLASALRMDDERIMLGFADFDRRKNTITDANAFTKIDARRQRRQGPRRVPPQFPRGG